MNMQPAGLAGFARYARDSLVNLVSSLGTAKDKSIASHWGLTLLDRGQLEAAYRGDWIARKIVDIPAFDSVREWRLWDGETEQVAAVEATEKSLGLQLKTMEALQRARLYGGSAIVLGIKDQDPSMPLDPTTIGKGGLQYIVVVNRHDLSPGLMNRNVLSPWYGIPEYFDVNGQDVGIVRVHPSRFIRFYGNKLPDLSLTTDGWGDSVLLAVNDAVKASGVTTQGIASLVQEAKVDVIHIKGLMENIGDAEYRERLQTRFQLANVAKSSINALLMDMDEEKWERINVEFAGLPDVARLYLAIASGAADIPATRMLGQSPQGMNATGDSDTRNYYDRISADQKVGLQPTLNVLDECLIWSTFGSRPEELRYDWNPLWQLDGVQTAAIGLQKAQAFEIDLNSAPCDLTALREGRVSQLLEDGTYPALEDSLKEINDLDLNEEDPEVAAQFAESKALAAGDPAAGSAAGVAAAVAETPQDTALNGAQIQSLVSVLQAVSEETLPPDTAQAVVQASFPLLTEEQVSAMIDPLRTFEPSKPAPPVFTPFGRPPARSEPEGSDPSGEPDSPDDVPPEDDEGDAPRRPVPPQFGRDAASVVLDPRKSYDGSTVGELLRQLGVKVRDQAPLPLCVRRQVLNAGDIIDWAKAQGFETILRADDLHVTVLYSRQPVDWLAMGQDWAAPEGPGSDGTLVVPPGGPRIVELFGESGAVVLQFANTTLQWRHQGMVEGGATHDFDGFVPHVTITYVPGALDLSKVEPYRGAIRLGPEIFEAIDPAATRANPEEV